MFPIVLHGFDFVDPGGDSGTLRFAGAMQVGNWTIADIQYRRVHLRVLRHPHDFILSSRRTMVDIGLLRSLSTAS